MSKPLTVTEPSPAERVRSVLAAATSLSVSCGQQPAHLLGPHTVTSCGQILLDIPVASPLRSSVAADREPATIEVTDIAPVAVRDRVRARITLAGWLSPHREQLRFEPAHAALTQANTTTLVTADDIAAASTDPLSVVEADFLTHLDHAHADEVALLTRLLSHRHLQSAQRVRPLSLDRYGLVLRIERIRSHVDARLPFHRPVSTPDELGPAMHYLLTRTRTCRRRRGTAA